MGARGGAKRVVAWMCPTCHILHGTRKDAVECCDERVYEQRAAKRVASAKRTLDSMGPIRFVPGLDWEGKRTGGTLAVTLCPKCKRKYEVLVPTERTYRGANYEVRRIPKEEGRKKARALVKAQLARHLPCSRY